MNKTWTLRESTGHRQLRGEFVDLSHLKRVPLQLGCIPNCTRNAATTSSLAKWRQWHTFSWDFQAQKPVRRGGPVWCKCMLWCSENDYVWARILSRTNLSITLLWSQAHWPAFGCVKYGAFLVNQRFCNGISVSEHFGSLQSLIKRLAR